MHKYRLPLFIANFIAASLALGSAFLPWWSGALPLETDSTALLSAISLRAPVSLLFSVAIVIFVTTALMLVAAIIRWKFCGLLGALIGGATLVLWFINSGLSLTIDTLNSGAIGLGVPIMLAAVLVALVALFIPKHQPESLR